VLRISSPTRAESRVCFGSPLPQSRASPFSTSKQPIPPHSCGNGWRLRDPNDRCAATAATERDQSIVHISPTEIAKRQSVSWPGARVEIVQAASLTKTKFRFRSPSCHLLVAYEQGSRSEGETFVEGLPRSARREMARKLTLVPANHQFYEWHEPRAPLRLVFFHFDPTELRTYPEVTNPPLRPRMFFEDQTLWGTVVKVTRLIETPAPDNQFYLEALGMVLLHELARLDRGGDHPEHNVRGGLAAWQQRIVTTYIDEHLGEHISLATLAQLARLSPYHFCRAFKQSLGVPPHQYHTRLRIERAKLLLEKHPISVTEIGITLGFSDTSSFTAAFRKATGLTPTGYHRSVA
jgi:AraC family transcriptional regulator